MGIDWPKPYVTSQDGYSFDWIPGGAVSITRGLESPALKARTRSRRESLATIRRKSEQPTAVPRRSTSLRSAQHRMELPAGSAFIDLHAGRYWSGSLHLCFCNRLHAGEAGFYRFFAYMGLFMFAMLVLVMGSNFLMMFVGWEGVGLCSYLIIGYYFDRQEAANASRKAFITNRVGDFGFALAIFGIIATFGSAQYTEYSNKPRAIRWSRGSLGDLSGSHLDCSLAPAESLRNFPCTSGCLTRWPAPRQSRL